MLLAYTGNHLDQMFVAEGSIRLEGDTGRPVLKRKALSFQLGAFQKHNIFYLVEIDCVADRSEKRQKPVLNFPLDGVEKICPGTHFYPPNAGAFLC